MAAERARSLGVTIEATYTIGEYDILILSAKQSDGLETWLRENGYRVPPGASKVLGSYLRQGLHFFVAKVNLEQQSKLGFSYLRPLQVAYESPRFMLPIRLGVSILTRCESASACSRLTTGAVDAAGVEGAGAVEPGCGGALDGEVVSGFGADFCNSACCACCARCRSICGTL